MFRPHRPNHSVQILFVFIALSLAVCLGSLSGEVVSASANGAPESTANTRALNTSGSGGGEPARESSLSKYIGALNFGGMGAANNSFLPGFLATTVEPCAAPSFLTPKSFTVGSSPRSVASADFNGDGKLDVAVANSSSHNVSIFLGDGTGNFNLHATPPVGSAPYSITTAHFNNDTIPDLVTANLNGNNVSVLIGSGSGTFTRTDFSTGASTSPRFVVTGDFDGDGDADLATANRAGNNVSVRLNNGAGGFGTATQFTQYGPLAGPNAMAVGDFNLDGRLDIAVANEGFGGTSTNNAVSILYNNGVDINGAVVFVESVVGIGAKPYSLLASDLNLDGKLDLAVGIPASGSPAISKVAILLGMGADGFGAVTSYPVVQSAASLLQSVATSDFNNDGLPDLAVADTGLNTISILLGSGSGAFGSPTSLSTGALTSPRFVTSKDFNADGRNDLIVVNGVANSISVYLNNCSAPDLTLAKTHVGNFSTNNIGNYTLTVTNAGTGASTGTITVSDTLPAGLSFISGSGTNWTCTATDQAVTCTNPEPLAAGASTSITLSVDVLTTAAPGVTNTASVANNSEIVLSNNTASDTAAVNTPPVADAQSINTDENSPAAITLTASDANGDALTFSVATAPAHGTLSGTGANLTYTPGASFNGTDSFTFKANDGKVDSAPATVTITVNGSDDAPVAVNDSYSVNEDGTLNVSAPGVLTNDTDPEGSPLTIIAEVDDPSNGVLALNQDGSFTYTPNANFNGTDSFTYIASDGANNSNTATVNITVNSVNDVPQANAQSIATDEDIAVGVTLTATDTEASNLTYSVVASPAHGTLSGTGANLTYTPTANYNGTDSFTFKVNDGLDDSNIAAVSITINPVNDAPVAVNDSYSVDEDATLSVPAPGVLTNDTDPEDSPLTIIIVSNPSHGTLTLNQDGSFTFTPVADYNGADSFTYKTSDGALESSDATVNITVNSVNDVPQANAQSIATDEDIAVGVTLTATDTEASNLTYSVVASPAHGTLSGTGANLTYTPTANYNGTDSFTFKANDGLDDSNIAAVSITINPVNDAPVAVNDSYTINDGDTLTVPAATGVLLNDGDIENSPLVAAVVDQPASGLTFNPDGSFSFTTSGSGVVSFTYMASDGALNSNLATVSITVNAITNLAISQTDSVDPANVGSSLAYTLTVTNLGPSAATNVVVTDTLPSGIVFESATASQGVCTGTSTVTCNLGSLARDAAAAVTIYVTPPAAGTLTNTASVTSPETDPDASNNSATESTSVVFSPCTASSFASPTNFSTGANPFALADADFNGDGRRDIAVANRNSSSISILLGNNARGFDAARTFLTIIVPGGPSGLVVRDFNADGKLDIVTANRTSNKVLLFLGDGTGNFTASVNFDVGVNPVGIVAGNFDSDGKPDIATANENGGTVSVLLNNGAGGFNAAQNIAAGATPNAIVTEDFDGDGKLDLAVSSRTSTNASVLFGNGAGGFGALQSFNAGTATGIATGNFNGDNRPDLAFANSANISVVLNNGSGGFLSPQSHAVGTSPHGIAVGDINGDGNPDLVVANKGSNNVTVLNGDGTGAFTSVGNFAADTSPNTVIIGDFSRDGRADIVVANGGATGVPGGNNVSLLVNTCSSPDLRLTKTHTGDFQVGTNGVYNLAVTNVGSSSTFGAITVTDTLPTGLTYISATGTDWSCSASGQTVTCTSSSSVIPTATTNITLTVGVGTNAALQVTNTASLTNPSDINPGNNSASDSTNVRRVAELALTQTASANRVAIGNNVTFTIGVTNNGPSTSSNTIVTDTLPAGLTFVSSSSSRGTCSGTSTVTCNLSTMNSGASATITIVATANAAGILNNTASVAATELDTNTSNNAVTVPVTSGVGANLSIAQTASPTSVPAGSNVTYTITINNVGEEATSVVVSDNLPSNTTFVSCAASGIGICGGSGNNRTVTFNSLAGGASATITLVANVNNLVAGGTVINNTATVSSAVPDPQAGNNSVTTPVTVLAPAVSITPTQTDFGNQMASTTSAPRTITVANGGTAPLVISSVTLGGLHPTHFKIASNTCLSSSGVAPGASCAVGVSFAPTVIGSRSATLSFTYNASGSPQGVLLIGEGTYPTAAGWGSNNSGQLGNNTTVNATTPSQVFGLTNGVIFEGGTSHSLALKPDGTVWAWGVNNGGQLGDGSGVRKLTPVQVSGLTNVIGISAGANHSLAVKLDGTVWAWGTNTYGQLGDGTKTTRVTPVQITSLTGVQSVSAGSSFSVAVKSDGTIWTWGTNTYGQLGDGTKTARLLPTRILTLSGVRFASAGSIHVLAVKNDDTVWAWGRNNSGQIGNGSTTTSFLNPVQVTALSNIATVAAGGTHSVALTKDGNVFTWGANNNGQLGTVMAISKSLVPIQVASGEVRLAIAAGLNHTLLLKVTRSVIAAGNGAAGQLGRGSTANSTTFVDVVNLTNITTIAAGDNTSFAAVP